MYAKNGGSVSSTDRARALREVVAGWSGARKEEGLTWARALKSYVGIEAVGGKR